MRLRANELACSMFLHSSKRLKKLTGWASISRWATLHTLQMLVDVRNVEKFCLEPQCQNNYVQKENLLITQKQNLHSIRKELWESKLATKRLTMRFARLKETPVGYREQVRRRRDVSTLIVTVGRKCKSTEKTSQEILLDLQHQMRVQQRNAEEGCSGQLYGHRNSHVEVGWVFASLLSRTGMESILNTPKMMAIGEKLVTSYLDKFWEICQSTKKILKHVIEMPSLLKVIVLFVRFSKGQWDLQAKRYESVVCQIRIK